MEAVASDLSLNEKIFQAHQVDGAEGFGFASDSPN